ncbi:hypothetical protein D3C84_1153250 [compost metagenome]
MKDKASTEMPISKIWEMLFVIFSEPCQSPEMAKASINPGKQMARKSLVIQLR